MSESDERRKEIEAISWKITKTEKMLIVVQYVMVIIYCIWSYTGAYNTDARIGSIPANIIQSWIWGAVICAVTTWFAFLMYKDVKKNQEGK